jgi:hypothetical protein
VNVNRRWQTFLLTSFFVALLSLVVAFFLWISGWLRVIPQISIGSLVGSAAGVLLGLVKTPNSQGDFWTKVQATWKGANRRLASIIAVCLVFILTIITLFYISNSFDPYLHKGIPYFSDSLTSQDGNLNWDEYTSSTSRCKFVGNAYRLTESTTNRKEPTTFCQAANSGYQHFVYEVEMTIIRGDFAGINLDDGQAGYYFGLREDGHFDFRVFRGPNYRRALGPTNPPSPEILPNNFAPMFHTGFGKSNQIAVIITNDHEIDLYVNRQLLVQVRDVTPGYCKIGVFVRRQYSSGSTIAEFHNAKVWLINP